MGGSTDGSTTTFLPAEIPRPSTTLAPTTTAPPPTSESETLPFADQVADLEGVIAVTGPRGLALIAPTGRLLAQFAEDATVTQPTWSRDGMRMVATVADPASGTDRVMIVDLGTQRASFVPAVRRYFFYSWSHDGRRLAALGPGPDGTTLDILDGDGVPLAEEAVAGGSVYLAWDPGGTRLVVHADDELYVLADPADATSRRDLAVPGRSFLAPAWIPGTGMVLFATDTALVTIDVDTGEQSDLGVARGGVELAVHPDGERAVMAHGADPGDPDAPRIEEVDLRTGARTPVSSTNGFWLEWSPSGDRLLVASAVEDRVLWSVWDGTAFETVHEWVPSDEFFNRYLVFAGQYTESPRLWSPDGKAIVYGARVGDDTGAVVLPLDGRDPVALVGVVSAFWGRADAGEPAT